MHGAAERCVAEFAEIIVDGLVSPQQHDFRDFISGIDGSTNRIARYRTGSIGSVAVGRWLQFDDAIVSGSYAGELIATIIVSFDRLHDLVEFVNQPQNRSADSFFADLSQTVD